MSTSCDSLEKCSFFKKYQETQHTTCKSFINIYCKGEKKDLCKRLEYRKQHGQPPVEDMLPSGQMFHALSKEENIPLDSSSSIPFMEKKAWWRFWK